MRQKDDMETHVTRRSEGKTGRNGKSPSTSAKAEITRNIKLAFGPGVNEPIPPRWLELLDDIDTAKQRQDEGAKSSKGDDSSQEKKS